MVRPSVVLPALCLSASATATLQHKWTNGDTATGTTGDSVIEGCEYWINDLDTGDSCKSIEAYFGITEKQFLSWNPSVPYSCTLVRGWSYCVAGPENPVTSSSTTATPTPAGTLTYSGTAAPTQSGVSSSCEKYYLVQKSDTCYTIQDSFTSFTLQQFYSWNPSISTGCEGLLPGYYVCVGDGSTPTSPPVSSPTATGSATVTGHQPQQTGIPSNCNKWYWVVDDDDCATIASKHDIAQQQFYEWNPATGSTCTTLWSKAYVCVGVSGSSSSASTTSVSKTTTAPSTTSGGAPGPTGSDTVTNCVTYYEAQSGDSCWSIVNEKYTYLTQALLTKWNPSLGDACILLKDQYYCVAIKAAQPMPGTIDTCKTWHLVASGDDCWQIEQDNGITAAQFNAWNPQVGFDCAGLWLGYYVCVGV
ncbi:putative LysM domain protein [Aspergillus glaucus CBS 516.65]|uniref:LysM domain-containing protein n=1 Tax=Aspergillus glaucus CBS 516.65 TaxID=1160497 RepID=A0A1L9VQX7_ASPGL|nr:hypothetical protein ASPGLDRAFT_72652 [Aspergillus glaucus CBS 516.65]OJJ86302.1 hypothetical protein ASPGLDRAFT_72652 [Aspergillus glaucus CBS 516.65]